MSEQRQEVINKRDDISLPSIIILLFFTSEQRQEVINKRDDISLPSIIILLFLWAIEERKF